MNTSELLQLYAAGERDFQEKTEQLPWRRSCGIDLSGSIMWGKS